MILWIPEIWEINDLPNPGSPRQEKEKGKEGGHGEGKGEMFARRRNGGGVGSDQILTSGAGGATTREPGGVQTFLNLLVILIFCVFKTFLVVYLP